LKKTGTGRGGRVCVGCLGGGGGEGGQDFICRTYLPDSQRSPRAKPSAHRSAPSPCTLFAG
jgi:hypothetical protein